MIAKQYHLYIPSARSPKPPTAEEMAEGLGAFLQTLSRQGRRLVKVHASLSSSFHLPLRTLQEDLDCRFRAMLPGGEAPAVSLAVQPPFVPFDARQDPGTAFQETASRETSPAPAAKAIRPGLPENTLSWSPVPVCAEIWSIDQKESASACSFLYRGLTQVRLEDEDGCELWSSGFQADYHPSPESGRMRSGVRSEDVQKAACTCFEGLDGLLETCGFGIEDVFRQWNYIGYLLDLHEEEGKILQNYQIFNETRGVFYRKSRNEGLSRNEGSSRPGPGRKPYPAATGIGMDYPGICIDFVAVKRRSALSCDLPLKSPVQKDAFRYGQNSLVGDAPRKEAPLFERGRCFFPSRKGKPAWAMVSGTASIKGEKTLAPGLAAEQLENTLHFIDELARKGLSSQNFPAGRPFPGLGTACFDRARLYVKPGFLQASLLSRFREHYPCPCCCTVVQAEICRNDLTVEIEADLHYDLLCDPHGPFSGKPHPGKPGSTENPPRNPRTGGNRPDEAPGNARDTRKNPISVPHGGTRDATGGSRP